MEKINEVSYKDIERLDDTGLTGLLLRLLRVEADAHGLLKSGISVPLKITESDDGMDGHIQWTRGRMKTEWIPNRNTLFQCKATYMSPAKSGTEVCKPKSKDLKEEVRKTFSAKGTYVLFYGRPCNPKGIKARIKRMRSAIKKSGASYSQTATIEIYDAQRIANWCNQYASAVTYVREAVGLTLPVGLKTWLVWAKHPDHQLLYFPNAALTRFILQIRSALSEDRAVVRAEGLSGLGKSRLGLETFRASEPDVSVEALRDSLVYCDAGPYEQILPGLAADLCNRKIEGLLVVDNCPLTLHKRIAAEVRRSDSKLKLMTMDYVLSQPGEIDIPLIQLKPGLLDDVVRELLKNTFADLKEGDVERIAKFAQGFPKIAVLLAAARKRGDTNLGMLNDEELVRNLVWGREPPDPVAGRVIEACAIFNVLGLVGDGLAQRECVADKICGISSEDFYGHCQRFIYRGICQVGGDYIQVSPKPLALRLAAQWWRKRPPEAVPALLAEIAKVKLDSALCDQMAMLDSLPEARALTKQLCGERGPFGKAEVLITNEGSRLFRSLVEVNPPAAAETLKREFGNWKTEELIRIQGSSRRNLIWALEKVCFWKDTFASAAPILLNFAAAENEAWANNATNQFRQLFHVALPGTQMPLVERLHVIEDALTSSYQGKRKLAVEALGSALKSNFFSRMGGVESQGSRAPQHDYAPSNEEVVQYWKSAIKLLVEQGERDEDLALIARQQFSSEIRGLLARGMIEDVEPAIRRLAAGHSPWPEASTAIKHALEYERFSSEAELRLKKLLTELEPKNTPDRLRFQVSVPDWEHESTDNGYLDLSEQRAEKLADELAEQGTEWFEHLPILFAGEQRQGLAFGYRLGKMIKNPQPFADAALMALRQIPEGKRNSNVLAAFLAGVSDRAFVSSIFDCVQNDALLRSVLPELIRRSRPTKEDLKRLSELLKANEIQMNALHLFSFNSVLDHLPVEDVINFGKSIAELSAQGTVCGFHVLYMYCLHNKNRWIACEPVFKDMLSESGVLDEVHKSANLVAHAWEETVNKLLKSEPPDAVFASHVAHEIVASAAGEGFQAHSDYYIKPVLQLLLEKYFEVSWPIIGDALISGNWRINHNLGYSLGDSRDKEKGASLIAGFPLDFLKEWCTKHEPEAPRVLARISPLIMRKGESFDWHPLAKMLMDNFGDDEKMLSELIANWGTFSWSGSIIPYYERQLHLLKTVRNHKTGAVRKWAADYGAWIEERIQAENKREQEAQLGIR